MHLHGGSYQTAANLLSEATRLARRSFTVGFEPERSPPARILSRNRGHRLRCGQSGFAVAQAVLTRVQAFYRQFFITNGLRFSTELAPSLSVATIVTRSNEQTGWRLPKRCQDPHRGLVRTSLDAIAVGC